MKQDRTASAESARQGSEAEARITAYAEASIWTPRMVAALVNGVKGGKWFSLIDKVYRIETLERAWKKVRANKGASGVDGVGVERFQRNIDAHLSELSQSLRDGNYHADPVKRVEIDKGGGKKRPLGIPTIKDRIVQMAVKMVIEPIFETQFLPCSYGFRPGKCARKARRALETFLKLGFVHVVDADLSNYFDSIPSQRLMDRVKESVADGGILELLEAWLRQDIVSDAARWTPSEGTPQGAVISPLLANLYLHGLDQHLMSRGYAMVRYADDFVVLCRTEWEAKRALAEISAWVGENGLTLNPDKTHVGDCRKEGEGFDFLGYHYEAGGRSRTVRKKSLDSIKDRIRAKTPRRTSGKSLNHTIKSLNSMLRGWFNYFKDAPHRTFIFLDRLLRRRLRAMLRHRRKRKGQGRALSDHVNWPNSFFDEKGLFSLCKAHVSYSRS